MWRLSMIEYLTLIFFLGWKQLVINDTGISELVDSYHNKRGHLDRERTSAIIKEISFWSNMNIQISDELSHCRPCLQMKGLPSTSKC